MASGTSRKIMDNLLNSSIAECPICFENMDSRIMFCLNGHSFCGRCTIGLCNCAICRIPMSFTRNQEVERLIFDAKIHQFKPENFKCANCPKILGDKITICQLGHGFCNDCAKKVKTCNVCLMPVGPGRNRLLERFLTKFHEHRLLEIVKTPNLLSIASPRNLRSPRYPRTARYPRSPRNLPVITCPLLSCSFKGSRFMNHIRSTHAGQLVELDFRKNYNIRVEDESEKQIFFAITHEIFFVTIKIENYQAALEVLSLNKSKNFSLMVGNKMCLDIGEYIFKYTRSRTNSKVFLTSDLIKRNKNREFVISVCFSKK